jgi:hypothetical protein
MPGDRVFLGGGGMEERVWGVPVGCVCARFAVNNTRRNIETIGLLGGSLSGDGSTFTINTLIIPKQKGETDRVEMTAEEEIWDIFFQEVMHRQPDPSNSKWMWMDGAGRLVDVEDITGLP